MRRTLRLLANVKPGQFLEPGTRTGLTGLHVHGSPRSTLVYLYNTTLDKLQAVPEHSLYRQSIEALTKHRLNLVESVVPQGYSEWAEKAAKVVASHPEHFEVASSTRVDGASANRIVRGGKVFVIRHLPKDADLREQEWDGEINEGPELEGARTAEEREELKLIAERQDLQDIENIDWEPEPQLTAEQIEQLENKIGAGLIEEVIQVAEGELRLVDTMVEAKVWESLEEKPSEGQWTYFERKP
ncbi:hypothetical protein GQ53DRAFT_842685 [Thozetella sp. PMI_491]|nr:hypothetical protein GQ53DRAFT_842685 [Thozetella sp. PMI_491]